MRADSVSEVSESAPPPLPQRIWKKLRDGWASRSLAIGALATVLDLGLGNLLLHVFRSPTRVAAMAGTVLGATFIFFANRYFAFKEKNPKLGSPLLKFIGVTALSSVVHGQLMVFAHDRWGINYTLAKMGCDLLVFTFGQLLLLRYVVFPKPKHPEAEAPTSSPSE